MKKVQKDIMAREVAAMTESQAKGVLAYVAGYYIEREPDAWGRVWETALKENAN